MKMSIENRILIVLLIIIMSISLCNHNYSAFLGWLSSLLIFLHGCEQ